MKRIILLFVWLAVFGPLAVSQNLVKGFVYEDLNGNGKKDSRERGIQGVSVSNGKEVVLTDESGKYKLPVWKNDIVFVIKPSGYGTAIAKDSCLPQFYYIYKPEGSPQNYRYTGSKPTGKLPSSVDFPLVKESEPKNFKVLVFGDPQPHSVAEVQYYEKAIVKEVEGIKGISFGISLGDIVWNDLNLYPNYIEVMKKVGIPWYNVVGNHDKNMDALADSLSDETFEKYFGPSTYSFNYRDAHFIVLDDVLCPDPRGGKGYWGGFLKRQLDFIQNDLKYVDKNKLLVISYHIPLRVGQEETVRKEDKEALFNLLKDYPNVLLMSGHLHTQNQFFYGKEDGWQGETPLHEFNSGAACGDWNSGFFNDTKGFPVSTMRDGTPRGYSFLNIDGNQYTIDYKVAGKSADYQIGIYNPIVVPKGRSTSARIYANFYMGKKGDKVEYAIDGGDWKPMEKVETFDPDYYHEVQKWDYLKNLEKGHRPSNPDPSDHLWWGTIPTKLSLGTHSIEIRATDMYGRTFHGKSSYRIDQEVQ